MLSPRTNIDLNPVHEIFTPQGRIRTKYNAKGGEAFFGPVSDKSPNSWTFSGGSAIVDNPNEQEAFEIHGAIYQKWLALGGIGFGLPTTDESATPDGIGRFNHFNANSASIYWTPGTGAQAVYGAIHERWASLGWERSYLGYPTTDEVDFPDGGRSNGFQNGGIYWWPDLGAIDLRGVVLHYTGLHCFGETDSDQLSSADEPYFVLAVTTPQTKMVVNTQIYSDVDGGDSRPDLLELYRGPPYGINIGAALMEHDFGDPNKYRDDIQSAVDKAHAAGTLLLWQIPVVGPAVAAIAGPLLGKLMPEIAQAINDLLDTGDDTIGGTNLTLTARQMVVLAARTGNTDFDSIGYKIETPLISGDGASYKAYFGMVPS